MKREGIMAGGGCKALELGKRGEVQDLGTCSVETRSR